MYITPRQKKRYILATLAVAIGIPITVAATYIATQLFSNASPIVDPKEVIISNLTTTSVTLSWITEGSATGSVIVSKDGQEFAPVADSRGLNQRNTHYVEITDLEPDSQYSFKIVSNDTKYTSEGGQDFAFKTPGLGDSSPVPNPVYGTLKGLSGDDAIVFVMTSESLPVSSMVSQNGNWIVDLSALRSLDGTSAISVSSQTQIKILAQGSALDGLIKQDSYSSLFDSKGKVNSSVDLTLAADVSIIGEVPSEAKILTLIADGTGGGDTGGDSGDTGGDSGDTGGDTGGNSGNTGGNSGNTGGNSGNTGGNSGNTGGNSGNTGGNSGNTGGNSGNTGGNSGNTGGNTGTSGGRNFRIASDVTWNNLVLGESTTTVPNIDLGIDSVKITNLTDTGFNIVWVSSKKEQGSVKYGAVATTLDKEALDSRDTLSTKGSYYVHNIEVKNLLPNTTYYYEIKSGTDVFRNSGQPYSLKTFATLSSPPPFKTAIGKVSGATDSTDSVVIVQLEDKDSTGTQGKSTYASTMANKTGDWIVSIGDARNEAGTEYYNVTNGDKITALLVIYAESDAVTQNTDKLDTLSIMLTAKALTQSGSTYTRIPLLSDYGVLTSPLTTGGVGGGNSNSTGGGVGGGGTTGTNSGTTPKTGLVENFIIGSFVGVVLTTISVVVVYKKKPRVLPRTMMQNIN